ncbi:hypothetical protein JX265_010841 [Neoarthrinium moseri]|uniref:Uncharacterized protein n=1 Tax=Neoarthrinium moseri TaxID=1658444 RepID=A0A9P9WDF8_9PEZI|nr:uncharacterized protein JN550_010593 [Neoarthrinium moseri]KAI1841849.1 hypothetical protein JX266_011927 [Neoarthrinium moseri]KAI1858173.1 hypothetical protein JX265_010841 [Neoarthrinium moseri]KAI1861962.1 hypothetical protein JN550_010593 [Neoarthrinium moseri]
MLFDLKTTVLFGLLALAQASPVSVPGTAEIETRAKSKKVQDYMCGTVTLQKNDIGAALVKGRASADRTEGNNGLRNKFPHYFGNQPAIFGATAELREYPIIEGGTFQGQMWPGTYRVVYKKDGQQDFVGVMVEGNGGTFTICAPAPTAPEAPPAPPAPPAKA